MSDGPRRSLPMRRQWRDLAERAATPAYSAEQVAEAFPVALKRDFREAPLSQVRDILGGSAQTSLFKEDRAAQLEAARQACRGSAAGNTLIDCAIEDYRNHPLFARRMETFLNALLGTTIRFAFPRLWSTKGETLREFASLPGEPDWQSTRSCWRGSQWSSVNGKLRQCGRATSIRLGRALS